ncbi:MAG: methyl-accepting chemotaxis protein [Pseudomonadota bacterium]|nr:methyl-accepting chemotaxis protein [Pseudomonadota bacterium]
MFKSMSIKARLSAAFIVVFLLFGLGVGTALNGVFSTSERFEHFFATSQVRYTAYQTMFSDGLLSGMALRNLVLKPHIQKPYKVVPTAIERFDTAYANAIKAAGDDAGTLEKLKKIDRHWQVSRAAKLKVLDQVKAGDVQGATETLNTVEHPNWQQVRIAVQELTLAEEARARELRAQMLENKNAIIRNSLLLSLVAILSGALIAWLVIRSIKRTFGHVIQSLNDIASGEGDLTRRLDEQGRDEVAQLGGAFNRFVSRIQELIRQIRETGDTLTSSAKQMTEMSVETKYSMNQQESKIDQVATAMNEMTATVQEVARNAAEASSAAQSADSEAGNGNQLVKQAIGSINELASEVDQSAQNIASLDQNAEQIGTVLDVIRGIAEQTNLLALNAAIEAARAGEQGRGFAVVADEVRTLASRTQDSTQEIQAMIEQLQQGTKTAVQSMDQSREKTGAVVDVAKQAGEALTSITRAVSQIADMNSHIATAAEEQSAVSEDINQNVVSINTLANQAAATAEQAAASSQDLERLAEQLQQAISQFRV